MDIQSIFTSAKSNKSKILKLSRLGLESLPDNISELTDLIELDISWNRLTILPETLDQLTNLQILHAYGNQLDCLPSSIGQLHHLKELWLSNNHLKSLPDTIGQLQQIQLLSLSDNQLTLIPSTIGALKNLRSFFLSYNRLTKLPASFVKLENLEMLDISQNDLIELPDRFEDLKSLKYLFLHGNERLDLPLEVLGPPYSTMLRNKSAPQKPDKILEYYRRLGKGKKPLNEAKLIAVGRGGVGKTSLINRLLYNKFDPSEQKTEGINITEWKHQINANDKIRLNIWDFGGQEIMHATHQFFLTQRSLYILVLNGREGIEDYDTEYWLKLIDSFGGNSPVIIVMNKIQSYPFDLNRRVLQKRYPVIRDFIKTDCEDGTGIDELREAIERETNQLEDLRVGFPSSWFNIKNQLSGMKENYLHFDEYRKVCTLQGESDRKAQEDLAGYLHTLGIALNFRDDPRLQDTHVLNPHWVTNGIYKIINSNTLRSQNGEITLNQGIQILDTLEYPPIMCCFLFDLMKKFNLCFTFPDEDTRFLIPELLDKQQPEMADEFNAETCLNFQYHYSILPEGLLPRFIVRTHILSEGFPRWRTGVILHFEDCRALVKADIAERNIHILVAGPIKSCRRLLGIIRSFFDEIHRNIPRLRPQEMVPAPNYPQVVISYEKLLALEKENVEIIPEFVNNKIVEISVSTLLNGIDLENLHRKDKSIIKKKKPIRMFCSYSHKDERFRSELETHLKLLQRQGILEVWDDRRIDPGDDWKNEINENLEQADIIIMLVSSDFIASDYCFETEMKRAMERHKTGKARVIPIIIRDAYWKTTPLGVLQALPDDGIAVTKWPDRDTAWRSITEGIVKIAQELSENINT